MHKCVGSAGPYGGVLAAGCKKPSVYCNKIEVPAEPFVGSMWQNNSEGLPGVGWGLGGMGWGGELNGERGRGVSSGTGEFYCTCLNQACPEVLTGIWPTVGTDGGGERANFKYHLSLPDSGWLRLLLKLSWGPNCHQMGPVWGPG